MRTASSIICWIAGLLDVLLSFFLIPRFGHGLGWSICLSYSVIVVVLLLWRQYSLACGKKIACGVLTLLLVSPLGGILTLCIPRYDLGI